MRCAVRWFMVVVVVAFQAGCPSYFERDDGSGSSADASSTLGMAG